jgi:hypothetical protein
MSILIAIPVLGRPHRAREVVEAAEVTETPYRLLFLCSPGDDDEIRACRATGADVEVVGWDAGAGDFARKANHALAVSDEPWLFVVGDDTCFCPGWDTIALEVAGRYRVGVVGTNDRANPRVVAGQHATHNLVARWYAVEHGLADGTRPAIFWEGYDHNFVDDELVQTARARRSWAFARDSWVPHLHPNEKRAPWDETYAKGQRRFAEDQRTFLAIRRRLWARGLPAVAPPS